jgi:hypothetical protein
MTAASGQFRDKVVLVTGVGRAGQIGGSAAFAGCFQVSSGSCFSGTGRSCAKAVVDASKLTETSVTARRVRE